MGTIIIGAGISGLMAAHKFPLALILERGDEDSVMPMINATFYAHEFVPKFAEQEIMVRTVIRGDGTAQDYAEKIYGDRNHPVSMEHVDYEIKAWKWNSVALLEKVKGRILWKTNVKRIDLYLGRIYVVDSPLIDTGFFDFDKLITSVPLPVLLRMVGWSVDAPFRSDPIWLFDDVVAAKDMLPEGQQHVIYYPDLSVPYYRSNQMGGTKVIEFEYSNRMAPDYVRRRGVPLHPGKIWPHPEAGELVERLKQYNTFCAGRYACWSPKMLSHHTWKAIQEIE